MKAALSAYRRARNTEESRKADRALHSAVTDAAGNPHLKVLSAELVSGANLGFTHEPYSPQLHRKAVKQHAALVAVITARDAGRAALIASEHFQLTTGDAWRSALHLSPETRE